MTEDSPLTVAGAAAALGDEAPALRSLLIPEKGNRRLKAYGGTPMRSILSGEVTVRCKIGIEASELTTSTTNYELEQ
jgi:hypothetical protein